MTRASFDDAYERIVLGREFVEYRDYYLHAHKRYRRTLALLGTLGLSEGARHLDVGGGQMALLSREMYGFVPFVGDAVRTAAADVEAQGVGFQRLNLMDETYETDEPYDLVTLCEVIEHIPVPPYITLRKLARLLRPGGWLVMTTPNGFRVRNILRMMAGKEVLDIYRYPEGDQILGYQHECTVRQMDWQLRHAGYATRTLETSVTGKRGASTGARIGHGLTRRFNVFPHLRDGILIAARAPQSPPSGHADATADATAHKETA